MSSIRSTTTNTKPSNTFVVAFFSTTSFASRMNFVEGYLLAPSPSLPCFRDLPTMLQCRCLLFWEFESYSLRAQLCVSCACAALRCPAHQHATQELLKTPHEHVLLKYLSPFTVSMHFNIPFISFIRLSITSYSSYSFLIRRKILQLEKLPFPSQIIRTPFHFNIHFPPQIIGINGMFSLLTHLK